jgi:outer membrane protein assembly factor BamB
VKRLIYLILAGGFLLFSLFNCGKNKPTGPEDLDDPTNFTGYWIGTTSQSLPISFYVDEAGTIENLTVRIRMSFGIGTCITDFFSQDGNVTIENGSFSALIKPDESMGILLPYSILNGIFSSVDSVGGEYNGFTGGFQMTCGDHFLSGTGDLFSDGTWKANRKIMVNIESPSNNSEVSGIVDINVTVSSFNAITKVEFYINESLESTDISYPYSYSWNTTQDTNGLYTIQVIAYDIENQTVSDQHTVFVNNAKWECSIQGSVFSSPAIGSDGTIYVGTSEDFYAINSDGSQKWIFQTEDWVQSSPAIGSDGTIYVGTNDNNLYAINPDGTEKWAFLTEGSVVSSPAVGSDGMIYVGSSDSNLYAINPDGTEKWAFLTEGKVESSPAIGSDGTIYVGSFDCKIYAINPDGTKKWELSIYPYFVESSPAIGSDGTIYVGGWDGELYAINPDGTEKWKSSIGNITVSSPTIGPDGTIYAGSWDENLHAINPDGTEKWKFLTGDNVNSSPAIDSDGTIYVSSADENLYAINPDGSQKWIFSTGCWTASSPAIGPDGTIYMGGSYNFYALYGSAGLADTPWPMFRHDLKHSGRVGGP